MRATKEHTAVRRRQIVTTLLAIMAKEGVAGLSAAKVAARLGLVPSALYRHFKSKDAMLDAAIAQIAERLLQQVRRVRAASPDPLRQLALLLDLHAAHLRENQVIPHLIFSEELLLGPAARRRKMYGYLRRYIAEMEQIIAQSCGRRDAAQGATDPKTLSIMFMGLIQSAGIYWRLSGGKFDAAAYVRRAWGQFARLLTGSGAAPPQCAARTIPLKQQGSTL